MLEYRNLETRNKDESSSFVLILVVCVCLIDFCLTSLLINPFRDEI